MRFLLAFLLLPCFSSAQPAVSSITGLWKGYISTSEKELPYELVIAEKDGRLIGYSHTTFTIEGKDIVSVKKVNVRVQNQSIIVEDDDLIFDNFDAEAPRKIKQTNTLFLKEEGKNLQLTGTFESKATRTMRPARGTVVLDKKYSDVGVKLITKLSDLKVENTNLFTLTPPNDIAINDNMAIPPPVVFTESAADKKTTNTDPFLTPVKPEIARDTLVQKNITAVITPAPIAEVVPELPLLARQLYKPLPLVASIRASKPAVSSRKYSTDNKTIAFLRYRVTQPVPGITMPGTVAAPKPTITPDKNIAVATTKPISPAATNSTAPQAKQPAPLIARTNVAVAPVVDLSKRFIETIEELNILADSLVFSLYDNGTIDGDSVSIILNGKTIVSKQMLSTVAITKTVYLTPDLGDTIQLVMYAENLGSIAPNTGLLVLVYDNQRREIRFSGDLNKNAAITLRRKPR